MSKGMELVFFTLNARLFHITKKGHNSHITKVGVVKAISGLLIALLIRKIDYYRLGHLQKTRMPFRKIVANFPPLI